MHSIAAGTTDYIGFGNTHEQVNRVEIVRAAKHNKTHAITQFSDKTFQRVDARLAS